MGFTSCDDRVALTECTYVRWVIVGAVRDLAWCADLKVMLQPVIGRAPACSIRPRYVKVSEAKKERREFVECLIDYSEAINAHICLMHRRE